MSDSIFITGWIALFAATYKLKRKQQSCFLYREAIFWKKVPSLRMPHHYAGVARTRLRSGEPACDYVEARLLWLCRKQSG